MEGLETLCEVNKFNQELLNIYTEKKNYEKIILLCEKIGKNEISLWWKSLNIFIGKEYIQKLTNDEIIIFNNFIENFLNKLLEADVFIDINILEIINDENPDISINLITNFMNNALEKHNKLLEQKKNLKNYVISLSLLI